MMYLDLTEYLCDVCGQDASDHADTCPLFDTPDVVLAGEGW